MKATVSLALRAFIIGSLLASALNSQAQWPGIPAPLKFAFTVTIQNPPENVGVLGATNWSTHTVKVTTADILSWVTNAHKVAYPKGAFLALWPDRVVVMDSTGYQWDDLSDLFKVGHGKPLHEEKCIGDAGPRRSHFVMNFFLGFDDHRGTRFEVTGVARGSNITDLPYGSVVVAGYRETYFLSAQLVGEGSPPAMQNADQGAPALWTGTVSARATGEVSI
jgi:hypothetical protein